MLDKLLVLFDLTALLAILVLFLLMPAFIELFRPKDSGPRLIVDNSLGKVEASPLSGIFNFDTSSETTGNLAGVCDDDLESFVPNLEAEAT